MRTDVIKRLRFGYYSFTCLVHESKNCVNALTRVIIIEISSDGQKTVYTVCTIKLFVGAGVVTDTLN